MVPGTKTALVELAVVSPSGRAPFCSPTRATPTIPPGWRWPQRSSSRFGSTRPPAGRPLGGGPSRGRRGRVPQLPVEPVRSRRAAGVFDVGRSLRPGDGRRRRPRLRLRRSDVRRTQPGELPRDTGRQEVGVEMFSMSKTYGMAGWRLGFVLGNAEIVQRVDLLQDHARAGIFAAVQEAGIAALTGPQDSVRNGSPGTRRGETAWSRRSAAPGCRRPSRKEASTPGSSCRTESRWSGCLPRRGSRSRLARASAPRAPAGRGCRSR